MRKLLMALTLAFAVGMGGMIAGCGKQSGTNPEVNASIKKAATLDELRKRKPGPPNPALRPSGVNAPGKKPPAADQGGK